MSHSVQLYPAIEPSVFYVNIDQQVTIHGAHFSTERKDDGTHEIAVNLTRTDEDGDIQGCSTATILGVSRTVIILRVPARTFSNYLETTVDTTLLVSVTSEGRTIERVYPMTFDRIEP